MLASLALILFLLFGPVVAIIYGSRAYSRSSGHAFVRWLTALAHGIGVFILALIAYGTSVMQLAAFGDRSLGRSSFDRYAASNPMFAAFKEAEPRLYETMRESLIEKADTMPQAERMVFAVNEAVRVLMPLQSKYMTHADDASILAFIDSTISTRRAALELEPRICVLEMAGRDSVFVERILARKDEAPMMQASAKAQQAFADIIKSGAGLPARPIATEDETRALLMPLYSAKPDLAQILQVNLSGLEIEDLDRISAERASTICRAGIEVLEFLGTQPAAKAAAVVRAQMAAANRVQTPAN